MTNRGMFWHMGWQAWPGLGFLLIGHGFPLQVHISGGPTPAMKGHRFLFSGCSGALLTYLRGKADHSQCK